MVVSEYDEAIRLEPADRPATRRGIFSESWMIGNAVNGGVVMAAGLTALREHLSADPEEVTEHVDPVVVSAYFMTAAAPGPFTATTELMRAGRRLTTGQVSVWQDAAGEPADPTKPTERMRAIASFGNLDGVDWR